MLLKAIPLDAGMTVSAALERLARNGLWLDPHDPAASAWITERAGRGPQGFEKVAERLARDPATYGVAIRRQWYARVLWYPRTATEVLHACARADPTATLLDALGLHEPDSRLPIQAPSPGHEPSQEGVVLDGTIPIGVSLNPPRMASVPVAPPLPGLPSTPRSTATTAPSVTPAAVSTPQIWPRLEAPDYAPARQPFEVVVGFAAAAVARVTGGPVVLTAPAGSTSVALTVELIADGLDASNGWSRPLVVPLNDPASVQATFQLTGRDPAGSEPVHLTTLEVRYVLEGAVCGTASRPLVIGPAGVPAVPDPASFGTAWIEQGPAHSPVSVQRDSQVADLTIEISKPDRNDTNGRYVCRLHSPHALTAPVGPHDIDLGNDAKTFAKNVVEEVRAYSSDPIVDNTLRSLGSLVAEKLPAAAIDALREVAALTTPAAPAVLIVSADPYVPWELALIDPPLDPARPPYLGAQALVGRWLRTSGVPPSPSTIVPPARLEKPPAHPPAGIAVRHMAVMAGMYKASGGLRRLPEAELEAKTLIQTYDAIPLAASLQSLKSLLDARLEHNLDFVGGAAAVHFAGHGEFDPARTDGSVLFLSDGKPLSSFQFRSARYGGELQPLLFLNACMIGIGGELLGDMGGFPGNCLRGGFGGFLGALWEVDDAVARDVALEFWRRALPKDGATAEPVAAILRDLRSRYDADLTPAPIATYLAYVYYGHPRLTLQRVV